VGQIDTNCGVQRSARHTTFKCLERTLGYVGRDRGELYSLIFTMKYGSSVAYFYLCRQDHHAALICQEPVTNNVVELNRNETAHGDAREGK